MSIKYYLPLWVLFFCLTFAKNSIATTAYDQVTGELLDFDENIYQINNYFVGQEVEFYNIDDQSYKTAAVVDVDSSFSFTEIVMIENETNQKRRLLFKNYD